MERPAAGGRGDTEELPVGEWINLKQGEEIVLVNASKGRRSVKLRRLPPGVKAVRKPRKSQNKD